MKKVLLFFLIISCTVSTLFGNNNSDSNGTKVEVIVNGKLNNKKERSLIDPIVVTYNSSCLTINFNVSLGQTDIIIENEYGNMAYNSSTNVNEHDVLFIPIGNLPSGTYYITIICDGGSAEGEFRIENN